MSYFATEIISRDITNFGILRLDSSINEPLSYLGNSFTEQNIPEKLDPFYIILLHYRDRQNMSTINVQQQISENKRKLGVIGLVALPIVAAMAHQGSASLEQIPQILTSGVFPVLFTIGSLGLAVKMALKLRK